MKKYIFLFFLSSLCFQFSYSQGNPSVVLARRIADRMKDTLSLTPFQTQTVYNINLNLHIKKMQARNISPNTVIVRQAMQAVEKTRDSLYRIRLTPSQYQLYLQKKKNIIRN